MTNSVATITHVKQCICILPYVKPASNIVVCFHPLWEVTVYIYAIQVHQQTANVYILRLEMARRGEDVHRLKYMV